MDERPDALLKSALEKIVYFEARSEQLTNDLNAARSEGEHLKLELASASQREIELRRLIAELEVRATRAHQEKEELGRVNDALRAERAQQIGKLIEASRIHDSNAASEDEAGFDLASFISELRGEVIANRGSPVAHARAALPPAPPSLPLPPPPEVRSGPAVHAERFHAEGRLKVSRAQVIELSRTGEAFPGRTEETLFGFSVRELSAPDSAARIRAAERLKALAHPAAAPALATALHAEADAAVQVVLLNAFSTFAQAEGVAIVAPLLSSPLPDVRIAALKALMTMDASQAGPHLAAAIKDPDRAVRRRASLLALGLAGDRARELGEQAIHDVDAEVRSLAALVLGAGGGERARELLLQALRDRDQKVRHSASQSLSRILGQDVSAVVSMDDAQRRREVRRLSSLPVNPVLGERSRAPAVLPVSETVVEPTTPPPPPAAELARVSPEALCGSVLVEVRSAIRGRSLENLEMVLGSATAAIAEACDLLVARGQLVRRGPKFFVA